MININYIHYKIGNMETPVEEHRHRQLNVRIGHQTTPWSLLADRFGIAFIYSVLVAVLVLTYTVLVAVLVLTYSVPLLVLALYLYLHLNSYIVYVPVLVLELVPLELTCTHV